MIKGDEKMFKMKKLLFLLGTVGLLSMSLVGCSNNNDKSVDGAEKVSVGALNNYPPLIFKQDGKLTGFEYDLLQAVAKEENLELEFKEMKFDGFIPGLQSNQVDIGMSTLN